MLTENDFFPSKIIEFETMIERSADFNTWETIVIENGVEIGPRRMIVFFFNEEKSLILQYLFGTKKLHYFFVRRKISVERFNDSIFYIKKRLETIEMAIERSIRKAEIPEYHKEALVLILQYYMDEAYNYRLSNPIERTKVLFEGG